MYSADIPSLAAGRQMLPWPVLGQPNREDTVKPQRRRVLVSAPDVIEVVTEEIPSLAPGEALVETLVSGICGSDKAGAHGEHAFMKPPYYPGHEVVGVVGAVAEGVSTVAVGDRVTVEPTLPCGQCKPCRSEMENLCDNLQFFGCGYREGGMADVFAVRADRLHKVPASFSNYQAALIEPLATPIHAVRLAGNLAGKSIAILGAGHNRPLDSGYGPGRWGSPDRMHGHVGSEARTSLEPRSRHDRRCRHR